MKSRLKRTLIGIGVMGILLLNQPVTAWAEDVSGFTAGDSDDKDAVSETGDDSRQNNAGNSETGNGVPDIQNDNGMQNDLSESNAVLQGNGEAPDVSDESGWKEINGHRYYYDAEGKKVTGWYRVQGTWYYFDAEDPTNPGIMVLDEKRWIKNAWFCFEKDGSLKTGWVKRDEGWYYANPGGAVQTGWQRIGSLWYYLDGDNVDFPGIMVSGERKWIKNAWFCFETNGVMKSGWVKRDEGWYYTNPGGAIQTGWQRIGNFWYYLDGDNVDFPGIMVSGERKWIKNAWFCFEKDGSLKTGWVKRDEGWYYTNPGGAIQTGWQKVGNYWYYLDGSDTQYPGLMLHDVTVEINGLNYTFLSNGAMKTGWSKENGDWYYYDSNSGQMVSDWRNIGGLWYYFDPNDGNKMVTEGWHEIKGARFYIEASGAMATGWKLLGGNWYYFGSNGAMRTGWQQIGMYWYYFYYQNNSYGGTYGAMAKNTTIDGYRIMADGRWLPPEQLNMHIRAQMYSSSSSYLILVDRASCRVGVFTGWAGNWNLTQFWSCSPGKPSTPTVGGNFRVGSKGYYFDSGSARCYWYTQFYGNYLFHSVLYNRVGGGLQDGRLGMHLSHGCVRMDINAAKWIYDNIPAGTTVVVY